MRKHPWRWTGAAAGLTLALVCTFFFGPPVDKHGEYHDVSLALCMRFAGDAAKRQMQWRAFSRTVPKSEAAKLPPPGTIFGDVPDEKIAAAVARREAAEEAAAASDASNAAKAAAFEADAEFTTTVSAVVKAAAPDYLRLCEKLTDVYVRCDRYSKEPERFRQCVHDEQKPAVAEIAGRLFRDLPR